jgi:Outer membrane protein beta-barrel domain
MKKLLICILCFASVKSFAQFRLGVQGSFASLNMWQTDGYSGYPSQENTWQINGFSAGIVAEYDLGYAGVELQSGLVYGETGSHLGQGEGFTTNPAMPGFQYGFTSTELRIYSLRLPLNILYGYRVNPKFKVFGGVGPYIAKALSGTETGTYYGTYTQGSNFTGGNGPINNQLKFNSNFSQASLGESNVSSIDVGFDILAGFQYKKLQISASWNRSFSTVYRTPYVNLGNQFWSFTLGYLIFGHERKPQL